MSNVNECLKTEQAINNQRLYGKNIISYKKQNILLLIFEFIIKQPMFYLGIIGTSIYIYLNKYIYALIFIIITILILIIYGYLINKIKKMINIMSNNDKSKVTVIRDNKQMLIDNVDITINDIMLIKKGDKIEADAIILECNNLTVDENNLDNNIVKKSFDLLDKNAKYKSNYVYADTFVINGNAKVRVINIGNDREFVKNIKKTCEKEDNNLVKKANKFSKILMIFTVLLSLICFVNLILDKQDITICILSTLTILLNIIPLNYSLIIFYHQIKGIHKNINEYATIKDINKLETLKDLSYLIINKTNYITENAMKLKDTFANQIHNEELIKNGLLALNFLNDDKIKQALEEVNTQYIDDYKLVKKYPYNNKTKITASIYEKNNEKYIYAIGSLENIFDISNLDVEQKYKLYTFQKDLHKRGLHILAVSSDIIENEESDFFNYNLHFDGIIAFYEPLKENINNIISEIQNMNINILMLTNDNESISKKIGKDILINNYENVISNDELNKLDDINKLKEVGIITNVSDKNKERIINLLIKNNKVGITIDDIDDLYSVNNSDIKITTEQLGSDLIKDKSDLILKSNDLNLIIKIINRSKIIYSNIKNILKYLVIVTSITVIMTSVFSIIFNFIFEPIYILCLVFIYVILSLVLYKS